MDRLVLQRADRAQCHQREDFRHLRVLVLDHQDRRDCRLHHPGGVCGVRFRQSGIRHAQLQRSRRLLSQWSARDVDSGDRVDLQLPERGDDRGGCR
ncbi:hypothetical protein D3C79_934390 [compost metagenome]